MTLMPTLFTAHRNPMNALGGTKFSEFLETWAEDLPRPRAILCISAHWERHGLAVTMSLNPGTIHDFYGFPEELYTITYPAPGAPDVGEEVITLLGSAGYFVDRDQTRGLDHGTWAPLRFFYPDAEIPVL
ncbi:class III extradiol ring-cleavage dioxygenase [uncultured Methanospirillum sp.]|uniref:dioxygenase family protein n=1 Tax=uncultured Methanospirillum sp. TaxID=262503 RepID=UPI002D1E39C8|nr:class III extradiol ring-cleavage dioxygenase [uncultured Methanospirillum sp.]